MAKLFSYRLYSQHQELGLNPVRNNPGLYRKLRGYVGATIIVRLSYHSIRLA